MGRLTPGQQDIAFLRIKAHPPFLGPILQVSQVFLQGDVVLGCIDVPVQQAVIYYICVSIFFFYKTNKVIYSNSIKLVALSMQL